MTPAEKAIVRALLDTPEKLYLWHNNAWFRTGVLQFVVHILPVTMEGFVASAEAKQAEMLRLIDALEHHAANTPLEPPHV